MREHVSICKAQESVKTPHWSWHGVRSSSWKGEGELGARWRAIAVYTLEYGGVGAVFVFASVTTPSGLTSKATGIVIKLTTGCIVSSCSVIVTRK